MTQRIATAAFEGWPALHLPAAAAGAVACGAWPRRQFRRLHPDQGSARSRARHSRRLQGRAAFEGRGRAADARLVARLPLAGTDGPDGGGPDRQSGHRGGHRAVHAGRCAGADRRRGAAAEPQRHRSGDLFPHLRLQLQRPDQWRPRGRQLFGLAQRQLRTRFLGQEPRRRAGGRRDRGRQPLRPRRRRADHADHASPTPISRCWPRRTGSAPRSATSPAPRASSTPSSSGCTAGTGNRPRRRAAGKRARQPARAGAAAAADARPEHQCAGDAGVAAAGSVRVTGGSLNQIASPRVTPGPAVGTADAASGHPAPGSAARLRHRQCRQRPRAVLSRAFN